MCNNVNWDIICMTLIEMTYNLNKIPYCISCGPYQQNEYRLHLLNHTNFYAPELQ